MGIGLRSTGDAIVIVGGPDVTGGGNLGQSSWLRVVHGREVGAPPSVDLEHERTTAAFIRSLIDLGFVNAVHDIADGGPMVALAEMCLAGSMGALVDDDYDYTTDMLFGECQGAYLVAFRPDHYADVIDRAEALGIGAFLL